MALVFLDSFDHYSTADISKKWTNISSSSDFNIITGRTGNGIGSTGSMGFALETFLNEITIGAALKIDEHASIGSLGGRILFRAEHPSARYFALELHIGDDHHCFFYLTGYDISSGGDWIADSGNIRFFNDFHGPISSLSLNDSRWYYLEMHATVAMESTPTGTDLVFHAQAYLNETPLVTFSQQGPIYPPDYAYGGNAKFSNVSLFGLSSVANALVYDDVYVTDGELLGDIRIGVLYPNAAGDISSMTPSPAGTNYTRVNEHTPDDDATYVATSSPGTDLYHIDDFGAFSGTIKGAQMCVLARKSDVGAATLRAQWKSGGTSFDGVSYNPSASSYVYLLDPRRKSVFTSSDWSPGELDGLQIGQTRIP